MLDIPNKRNQQIQNYIDHHFSQEDSALSFIKAHSRELGLPEIQIPAHSGKLLYLLAKLQQANRILEIGALGGYSTAWLARALPSNGSLITLEINPIYTELTRFHLKKIGLEERVQVKQGDAQVLLSQMVAQNESPFDLIFIDAYKMHNQIYLDQALLLSKVGTLILIDNLIPRGEEIGKPCNHEAEFIYQFNIYLANHPQLEVVLVPSIVGHQGRIDGLALARVSIC